METTTDAEKSTKNNPVIYQTHGMDSYHERRGHTIEDNENRQCLDISQVDITNALKDLAFEGRHR